MNIELKQAKQKATAKSPLSLLDTDMGADEVRKILAQKDSTGTVPVYPQSMRVSHWKLLLWRS